MAGRAWFKHPSYAIIESGLPFDSVICALEWRKSVLYGRGIVDVTTYRILRDLKLSGELELFRHRRKLRDRSDRAMRKAEKPDG